MFWLALHTGVEGDDGASLHRLKCSFLEQAAKGEEWSVATLLVAASHIGVSNARIAAIEALARGASESPHADAAALGDIALNVL